MNKHWQIVSTLYFVSLMGQMFCLFLQLRGVTQTVLGAWFVGQAMGFFFGCFISLDVYVFVRYLEAKNDGA